VRIVVVALATWIVLLTLAFYRQNTVNVERRINIMNLIELHLINQHGMERE